MANKVSRITICGIPYTIAHEKDNFDVDLHFGQIDYKTCTIRINDDISEALKIESLCHEMIHAILVHIGRSEMSQDEGFVQSLANAINQSFVPKIRINELPSAQPEQHEIGYSECANAMLKMWIDKVVTDGEYYRIMDKLNAHWAERREK